MVDLSDIYELMRGGKILGRGTDGGVMRGEERKSGEWHALKYLSTKGRDPTGAREKLFMTRAQHPNVVKLLAYYAPTRARLKAVLVMPEADFSLHEYICRSRGRTRPPESVDVDIAAQLSEGVAFLHQQLVVHRDLHPGNVLMTVEPSRPSRIAGCGAVSHSGMRVLVADFSRACTVGDTGMDALTAYGHCAPERLVEGSVRYGSAFDVWSLATIIFEVATTEPFVVSPRDDDISRKWALECCRVRTRRQLSHETLCRTAESAREGENVAATKRLQAWQDSYNTSEKRECPQCSAEVFAALNALLQWLPADRASAAETLAILTKGPSVAPSLTDPTLASRSGQAVASPHEDAELVDAVTNIGRIAEGSPAAGLAVTTTATSGPQEEDSTALTSAASRRAAPKQDLQLLVPQPLVPRKTRRRRNAHCGCSGHCLNPGHRRHGCHSSDLLVEAAGPVCVACSCTVHMCSKVKYTRSFCSAHSRAYAAMSWEWQITRATRGFVDALMPCDLEAFLAWFPVCHEDVVKVIMLTLLKEPSPIEAWAATDALEPHSRWTAERSQEFHASLVKMGRFVHKHPPIMEWKQLSTQGVSRFMGSLKTINAFRIARALATRVRKKKEEKKNKKILKKNNEEEEKNKKRPAASQDFSVAGRLPAKVVSLGGRVYKFWNFKAPPRQKSDPGLRQPRLRLRGKGPSRQRESPGQLPNHRATGERWSLGLTQRQYVATPGDVRSVSSFLRACDEVAEDWKMCMEEVTLLSAIDQANAIVLKIAQRCDKHMEKWLKIGYVRKSIVRKIAIGKIVLGKARVDWEKMTVADLRRIFPDAGEHLKDFPQQWSVADLSMFLFDRADLAIFASCYACLWHDVAQSHDKELVMAAVLSGRVERQARELRKSTGHCCVPSWIIECMNLE